MFHVIQYAATTGQQPISNTTEQIVVIYPELGKSYTVNLNFLLFAIN